MAFCNMCGKQIELDSAFCRFCGAALNPLPQPSPASAAAGPAPIPAVAPTPMLPPQQRPQRSGFRYLLWIGIGLCVVVLVAAGAKKGLEEILKSVGTHLGERAMAGPTQAAAVLKRDDDLVAAMKTAMEQTRGAADERLDRTAALIRDYVVDAKQAHTEPCSPAFTDAYHRYVARWSDLSDTLSSHPHIQSQDEAFVDGFLRSFSGDFAGAARQLDATDAWGQQVDARINEVTRARREAANLLRSDVDAAQKIFE